MMPRTTMLALATLAAACGGPHAESRPGRQTAHGERRSETARDESRGEPAGEEAGDAAVSGKPQAGVPGRDSQPRVQPNPQAMLGRDTVAKLQGALASRGLLARHEEGRLDAPTRDAVSRFQRQQGLAATGIPDRETLTQLGVSAEKAYGRGAGERG